jgi:uncharacterized protein YfaP (DUF2135 family)
LEIDSVSVPDIGEKYVAKLEKAKQRRRQLLVEQIRVREQEKAFNKCKDLLHSTDDVHALREINVYNVSMAQFELLEDLRTSILDTLQQDRFESLKVAINEATCVSELEEVERSGLNVEQTEALQELYEVTLKRLQFEDDLKIGLATASENYSSENLPFSMDLEQGFMQRIEASDGRNRNVQFSLSWDNKNDLDIVVRCPDSSLIYAEHNSPCGGSVDLEMNSEALTKKPLEHVIWDGFSTPEGTYEIFVLYRQRNALTDSTNYTVRIADGPDLSYYQCSISEGERVSLAARISLNSDEVRNQRITNDDDQFRALRSAIKSATNVGELPEIDGKIHSFFLSSKIAEEFEIRNEYLTDLAEKELKNQQLERSIELGAAINNASTVEELDTIVIDGVEPQVATKLERMANKRRIAVEKMAARTLKKEIQANYQTLLSMINEAESSADLADLPELELSEKDATRIQGIFENKVQRLVESENKARQEGNAQRFQTLIDEAQSLTDVSLIEIADVTERAGRKLVRSLESKIRELQIKQEDEEKAAKIEARVRNMLRTAIENGQVETIPGSDREEEVVQRMESEGAQSGAMSISLIWDNLNDLDLLVVDPNDEVIYSSKRNSSTGGVLDVDMNAKPQSKKAIENIYWQENPPQGHYHVFVHHYKKHIRLFDNDPTQYNIRINIGGMQSQNLFQSSGSISSGDPAHYAATFSYP